MCVTESFMWMSLYSWSEKVRVIDELHRMIIQKLLTETE